MPEPDWRYLLAGVLIAGGITWAMRALPFAVIAPLRESRLVAYLGERMPVGIMAILAVYTLPDVEYAKAGAAVSVLVALAITVGLQVWRHNATLSVFAGTATCVLLSSLPVLHF